ncbi:MAG: helix-turn-helix domain-containing protein [Lachnospiraceae bacterium]|nr:helix-turn-helix domain-containing protein [Lachnospiraceae bacterium]
MNSSKVGKTISFLRKHYHMTQHELAEKLGVTDKAVSRWENGYGTPDISLLTKLGVALDVDIESILEGNLTHWDMQWEGLLFLDYPEEIMPTDYMYGIRIVEFQIGFFALAGIKKISIYGKEELLITVKAIMGNGSKYGCEFCYMRMDGKTSNGDVVKKNNKDKSLMIIEGLCFLYGKDLTKVFRRIIYGEDKKINIESFDGSDCKLFFSKKASWMKEDIKSYSLERGTIAFLIKDKDDLLDASNLLRIIEKHQKERINCISEIAMRRGLIENVNITSL